jgi:hypothetical protein
MKPMYLVPAPMVPPAPDDGFGVFVVMAIAK